MGNASCPSVLHRAASQPLLGCNRNTLKVDTHACEVFPFKPTTHVKARALMLCKTMACKQPTTTSFSAWCFHVGAPTGVSVARLVTSSSCFGEPSARWRQLVIRFDCSLPVFWGELGLSASSRSVFDPSAMGTGHWGCAPCACVGRGGEEGRCSQCRGSSKTWRRIGLQSSLQQSSLKLVLTI